MLLTSVLRHRRDEHCRILCVILKCHLFLLMHLIQVSEDLHSIVPCAFEHKICLVSQNCPKLVVKITNGNINLVILVHGNY